MAGEANSDEWRKMSEGWMDRMNGRGNCHALLHVLDLYVWRVAFGFPSWEDDDCTVHRIQCPAKKGAVWEVRKVESEGNRG